MSDNQDTVPPLSDYETIFGGSTMECDIADHAKRTVDRHKVQVRILRVGEFPAATAAIDDPTAFLSLVTGLGAGHIQNLTPASYNALMEEVGRVNHDFFASLAARIRMQSPVLSAASKAGLHLGAGSPTARRR